MIHILAAKVAEYLIKNEAGKIENKESYVYGIEIIMEKVFSYSALLLFALYFNLLVPSLLFVTFFVLLRGYTGGYHANTYAGCFAGTIVIYLVCSQVVAPLLLKDEMKRNMKKRVLKGIGKIVEFEANTMDAGWPPICVGLIHQPNRPKKQFRLH